MGLHYHFKGDPGAQIRINYQLGFAELFKDGALPNAYNETFQLAVLISIKFGLIPDEKIAEPSEKE